jgi:hypothetical protein
MATSRTETFFPAPGFLCPALSVTHWGPGNFGWSALADDIAEYAGCHTDDLTIEEIYWDDDDRSAEFVLCDGRILGAIGVMADLITPGEWPAIVAAHRALANAA